MRWVLREPPGSALPVMCLGTSTGITPQKPWVLDAVNDCVVKAQQCAAHCLMAYQEGDTTLADCACKVNEMLPICRAFSYQLAGNAACFGAEFQGGV